MWLSCAFLTIVCLVGMEELGEIGTEGSSQLSRSRGAAATSGHDADYEILNFEADAFMGGNFEVPWEELCFVLPQKRI